MLARQQQGKSGFSNGLIDVQKNKPVAAFLFFLVLCHTSLLCGNIALLVSAGGNKVGGRPAIEAAWLKPSTGLSHTAVQLVRVLLHSASLIVSISSAFAK